MSIKQVVESFRSHLYIENPHLIYTPMAVYLSRTLHGDPVWMFPVGTSGYGKTELTRPYTALAGDDSYDIVIVDQLTPKGIVTATGVPLVEELNNRNTMIIISDLANILAMKEEERKQVLSQFRTVFDGRVKIIAGNLQSPRVYDNIHASLLGFSTPYIRRDVQLGSIMGTREILYNLPFYRGDEKLRDKEITAEGREEINKAVKKFIDDLNNRWVYPNAGTRKELWEMAVRTSIWRVEGVFDEEGYLVEPVEVEIPKRLYIQYKKLWMSYTKMGLSNSETWKVLKEIESGTGTRLRSEIHYELTHMINPVDGTKVDGVSQKTLRDIATNFNVGVTEARKQLMVLRSLECIELDEGDYGLESKWSGVPWP